MRTHRARGLALWLASGLWAGAASAADPLVTELEQRLTGNGVDAVNNYLNSRWAAAMVPLNRKTAACELHAVSLAVKLSRGRNPRAVRAHGEALRAAVGQDAGYSGQESHPEEAARPTWANTGAVVRTFELHSHAR